MRDGAFGDLTEVGVRLRLAVTQADTVLADVTRDEGPALIRALVEAGVDIHEARWVGTDLEAIFFTETGSVQTPETIHAR